MGRPRTDEAAYRAAEAALWSRHGLEPQELWVPVPGLGIRVRALVHGEGRPVVFVHGTPTAGGVFVPLVRELRGVKAIVVDRPGCALSEPLDVESLTPEGLWHATAASLGAVVEEVVGGSADVVGSSAGGMAALVLAARRPELVRSVALEGVPALAGMRLPRPMRAATFAPVAWAVPRHRVTERDLRRSFRAMGHGDAVADGKVTPEDVAWRVALGRHTRTYENELALLRRAASWKGLRREWAVGREVVESVRAPSLWVVGDRDPFATPQRVAKWAEHAAGSQVRVMEASGHQPWVDDPAAHARMLSEWWGALPAAGTVDGGCRESQPTS